MAIGVDEVDQFTYPESGVLIKALEVWSQVACSERVLANLIIRALETSCL